MPRKKARPAEKKRRAKIKAKMERKKAPLRIYPVAKNAPLAALVALHIGQASARQKER